MLPVSRGGEEVVEGAAVLRLRAWLRWMRTVVKKYKFTVDTVKF